MLKYNYKKYVKWVNVISNKWLFIITVQLYVYRTYYFIFIVYIKQKKVIGVSTKEKIYPVSHTVFYTLVGAYAYMQVSTAIYLKIVIPLLLCYFLSFTKWYSYYQG